MDYKNNYFNDSIVIRVTEGVNEILKSDAERFFFYKNEKPNINGFLNVLLPTLSDLRDELHTSFLKNNNDNTELCRIIEHNLYNVYLSTFTIEDSSSVNLSLRFTKANYNKFRVMHDTQPQKFDMDFTNYLRSLLSEYTVKRLYQRELLFMHNTTKKINEAIGGCKFCKIYADHLENESDGKMNFNFVPLSMTIHKMSEEMFVAGIDDDRYYIIPLVCINDIIVTDDILEIQDERYNIMKACINNYFETDDNEEEE